MKITYTFYLNVLNDIFRTPIHYNTNIFWIKLSRMIYVTHNSDLVVGAVGAVRLNINMSDH